LFRGYLIGKIKTEGLMMILVLGLVLFLGVHSVRIVAGPFRDAQVATHPGRWKGLYSLVSAAGLGLIIWGWMLYRPGAPQLYDPPAWGRHVALLLVWPAFILLAGANGPVGRIKATVRHPMLIGIILWSAAHLLANGDQASVLLFGGFLAFGVADLISALRRNEPAPVANKPLADVIMVVAGTAFYALFLLVLHKILFGVSPLG
jgi:uncharacterized membrane protein